MQSLIDAGNALVAAMASDASLHKEQALAAWNAAVAAADEDAVVLEPQAVSALEQLDASLEGVSDEDVLAAMADEDEPVLVLDPDADLEV